MNYTDGTKGTNFGNNFDKNAQDWQHLEAFVKPAKAFNSIDVYYHYNNQTGTARFDAARLEIGTLLHQMNMILAETTSQASKTSLEIRFSSAMMKLGTVQVSKMQKDNLLCSRMMAAIC